MNRYQIEYRANEQSFQETRTTRMYFSFLDVKDRIQKLAQKNFIVEVYTGEAKKGAIMRRMESLPVKHV